jgi:hypothetical protein
MTSVDLFPEKDTCMSIAWVALSVQISPIFFAGGTTSLSLQTDDSVKSALSSMQAPACKSLVRSRRFGWFWRLECKRSQHSACGCVARWRLRSLGHNKSSQRSCTGIMTGKNCGQQVWSNAHQSRCREQEDEPFVPRYWRAVPVTVSHGSRSRSRSRWRSQLRSRSQKVCFSDNKKREPAQIPEQLTSGSWENPRAIAVVAVAIMCRKHAWWIASTADVTCLSVSESTKHLNHTIDSTNKSFLGCGYGLRITRFDF